MTLVDQKIGWPPFAGMKTILRGKTIFRNEKLSQNPARKIYPIHLN
jgi:hypothetical protein